MLPVVYLSTARYGKSERYGFTVVLGLQSSVHSLFTFTRFTTLQPPAVRDT